MQTFYTKMPDETYFGLPFISQSKLKSLHDLNYAQWICKIIESDNRPYNDELRIGTVMHSVNLERVPIESLMCFKRIDGRSADGKKQKKDLLGLRSYIFEDELPKIKEMHSNFMSSFRAQEVMSKSKYIEHAAVSEIFNERKPENKIFMKFKPDIVGDDFICDFKTFGDYATDKNIRSSFNYLNYDFQAASYLINDAIITNTQKSNFLFIIQESIKPYGCRVISISKDDIIKGYEKFDFAIKKFIKAKNEFGKSNDPNYTEVNEIILNW